MAKVEEMPAYEREHLLSKLRPPLGIFPWVASEKPLSKKRIAIITTAGLSYRSGTHFELADAAYRAIPRDIDINELVVAYREYLSQTRARNYFPATALAISAFIERYPCQQQDKAS